MIIRGMSWWKALNWNSRPTGVIEGVGEERLVILDSGVGNQHCAQ